MADPFFCAEFSGADAELSGAVPLESFLDHLLHIGPVTPATG